MLSAEWCSFSMQHSTFSISRTQHYVDAEEGQVPEAATRPDGGKGVARSRRVVWRLRAQSARALLDDGATDRSGARGDDPFHQARRQDLDPGVPRQTDHQEA